MEVAAANFIILKTYAPQYIFYTWAGNQYQNTKISKYQNIKTENIFQEANSPSWKDQTFNEPKSSFD